jgi:hypothetical protein
MKIEIRYIDDPRNDTGRLLEIVETDTKTFARTQEVVLSAMIRQSHEVFGVGNYEPVTDNSVFGGYYRHKSNGKCIVAR